MPASNKRLPFYCRAAVWLTIATFLITGLVIPAAAAERYRLDAKLIWSGWDVPEPVHIDIVVDGDRLFIAPYNKHDIGKNVVRVVETRFGGAKCRSTRGKYLWSPDYRQKACVQIERSGNNLVLTVTSDEAFDWETPGSPLVSRNEMTLHYAVRIRKSGSSCSLQLASARLDRQSQILNQSILAPTRERHRGTRLGDASCAYEVSETVQR